MTAKLAELESQRAGQAARPVKRKKKPIPRPKGKGWKLIDGMRLSNDQGKYDRIIVRSLHSSGLRKPKLIHDVLAKTEEPEAGSWFQRRGQALRAVEG